MIRRFSHLLLYVAFLFAPAAWSEAAWQQSDSGHLYRITSLGGGKRILSRDMVLLDYEVKTPAGKSIQTKKTKLISAATMRSNWLTVIRQQHVGTVLQIKANSTELFEWLMPPVEPKLDTQFILHIHIRRAEPIESP